MPSPVGPDKFYGSMKHKPLIYFTMGAAATMLVVLVVLGGVLVVMGVPHWGENEEPFAPLADNQPEQRQETTKTGGEAIDLPAAVAQVEVPRAKSPEPTPGVGAGAVAPIEAEVEVAAVEEELPQDLPPLPPNPDQQAEAEMWQREKVFMEQRFFQMKDRMMSSIDAYYQLPENERINYMQQFMRQSVEEMAADREAAGLPAHPSGRLQQRIRQEFMQSFIQKATPQEREKFNTFIGDVAKDHMRQMQRQMEERMANPQP